MANIKFILYMVNTAKINYFTHFNTETFGIVCGMIFFHDHYTIKKNGIQNV